MTESFKENSVLFNTHTKTFPILRNQNVMYFIILAEAAAKQNGNQTAAHNSNQI